MKDGGPAFPAIWHHGAPGGMSGMSLRDWLAGMALAGFLANKNHALRFDPDADATFAYAIADAMLAESEKSSG